VFFIFLERHKCKSAIRPSIYSSLIVESGLNLFMEPTSTDMKIQFAQRKNGVFDHVMGFELMSDRKPLLASKSG